MDESKEPEEQLTSATPIDPSQLSSDLNDELNKIENLDLDTIKSYLNDSPSKLVPDESNTPQTEPQLEPAGADPNQTAKIEEKNTTPVKSHSYSLKSRRIRNFNIFKKAPLIVNSASKSKRSAQLASSSSSSSTFPTAKSKIVDSLVNKSNYEILVQGEKVTLKKEDYQRFIRNGKWCSYEFFRTTTSGINKILENYRLKRLFFISVYLRLMGLKKIFGIVPLLGFFKNFPIFVNKTKKHA